MVTVTLTKSLSIPVDEELSSDEARAMSQPPPRRNDSEGTVSSEADLNRCPSYYEPIKTRTPRGPCKKRLRTIRQIQGGFVIEPEGTTNSFITDNAGNIKSVERSSAAKLKLIRAKVNHQKRRLRRNGRGRNRLPSISQALGSFLPSFPKRRTRSISPAPPKSHRQVYITGFAQM